LVGVRLAVCGRTQGFDGDEYARRALERAGDGVSPVPPRAPNITPEPPTEPRRGAQ
jgi:hypothetical protein